MNNIDPIMSITKYYWELDNATHDVTLTDLTVGFI